MSKTSIQGGTRTMNDEQADWIEASGCNHATIPLDAIRLWFWQALCHLSIARTETMAVKTSVMVLRTTAMPEKVAMSS